MNASEIHAHATNTFVNQPDDSKTAEELLEEIEDAEKEELQKAILFFAGFNVLDVEEAFEDDE